MRNIKALLALVIITALAAMTLVGCSQPTEPTAIDQTQDQVEEQTDQNQATVDEALNSAQAAVSEYVSMGDGLETRVNGLKVKSDLQEIQRKLTNAIEQTGDQKVAALEELSEAFNNLIYRVEMAAGKAPAGGELQTELNDFATKLKGTQATLADAASSYEASGTTAP